MNNIGQFGGSDPYKLSKSQLDMGITSVNLDVVKSNPDVVPKKPADEFISRDLGLTLPKNPTSNAVGGWESLAAAEETELLAPVKSDVATSRPKEANDKETKLVMNELMKIAETNGTNASRASKIIDGLA